MYVSDEEDKPEMLIIASPVEECDHHCMDVPQDDLQFDAIEEHTVDDTFSSKAEKRPRMHFSPPPRLKIKTVLRTSP